MPICDPRAAARYAHIAYERQRALKRDVIADAFRRVGEASLDAPAAVAASPERGYRLRARCTCGNGRAGFFREGTHVLCDARADRTACIRRALMLVDACARRRSADAPADVRRGRARRERRRDRARPASRARVGRGARHVAVARSARRRPGVTTTAPRASGRARGRAGGHRHGRAACSAATSPIDASVDLDASRDVVLSGQPVSDRRARPACARLGSDDRCRRSLRRRRAVLRSRWPPRCDGAWRSKATRSSGADLRGQRVALASTVSASSATSVERLSAVARSRRLTS